MAENKTLKEKLNDFIELININWRQKSCAEILLDEIEAQTKLQKYFYVVFSLTEDDELVINYNTGNGFNIISIDESGLDIMVSRSPVIGKGTRTFHRYQDYLFDKKKIIQEFLNTNYQ